MDKVVSFGKGIRRQPSVGTDGELSELVNLVPKNGELVNVKPIVELGSSIGTGDVIIATHKVVGKNNIIAKKTNGDIYVVGGNTILNVKEYKSIAIVGNTLCISDKELIHYAVWKDEKYNLVNLQGISFDVKIESTPMVSQGAGTRTLDDAEFPSFKDILGSDKNEDFFRTDQLQSLFQLTDSIIEEWINYQDLPETYFKYVTLGIAAVKAYDGTYISYSDVFTLDPFTDNHGLRVKILRDVISEKPFIRATCLASNYDITINTVLNESDKEFVSGVDIFLSNSSAFYDFSKGYDIALDSENLFKIKNLQDIQKEISEMMFHRSLSVDISEFDGSKSVKKRLTRPIGQLLDTSNIPTFSNSGNLFSYNSRLHTFNLDVFIEKSKTDKTKIVPIGYEEYDFSSDYLDFTSDGYYNKALDSYGSSGLNENLTVEAVVEVDVDDPVFGMITNRAYYDNLPYPLPPILSYPSANAKSMRIYIVRYMLTDTLRDYSRVYMREFVMTPLLAGNLSICANVGADGLFYNQINDVTLSVDNGNASVSKEEINQSWRKVNANYYSKVKSLAYNFSRNVGRRENIIKYSPSGNPFLFPALNTVYVGEGEIKGISNSTKALSQGQFGQFPLYAFCSDGIWALEVANDGNYSAKQPISRDVCNNIDSITQIDGAVVFSTDQGLKLIQGSEVVLLSGQMDGHNIDESVYFPESLVNDQRIGFFAGYGQDSFDSLVVQETRDFRDILKTCKIAYDYPSGLLRIFPNSGSAYYVYSFNSREFSRVIGGVEGEVKTVITGYPLSVVQIGESLYTFDTSVDNTTLRDGLLLTRPIDMGEPFAFKKLQDMRLHYTKHNSGTWCKVVVYVSNDRNNWYVLPSLRMRSFKYYRLAVITKMRDDDTLSGAILRYDIERSNKLR